MVLEQCDASASERIGNCLPLLKSGNQLGGIVVDPDTINKENRIVGEEFEVRLIRRRRTEGGGI